jgi:hypothetical protein
MTVRRPEPPIRCTASYAGTAPVSHTRSAYSSSPAFGIPPDQLGAPPKPSAMSPQIVLRDAALMMALLFHKHKRKPVSEDLRSK